VHCLAIWNRETPPVCSGRQKCFNGSITHSRPPLDWRARKSQWSEGTGEAESPSPLCPPLPVPPCYSLVALVSASLCAAAAPPNSKKKPTASRPPHTPRARGPRNKNKAHSGAHTHRRPKRSALLPFPSPMFACVCSGGFGRKAGNPKQLRSGCQPLPLPLPRKHKHH
jgi:hypothetical protein